MTAVFLVMFGLTCGCDGYLVGSHAAAWLIVFTSVWTLPLAIANVYLALDG